MMFVDEALTVVLQGGLGNQLFQYAAGRALALQKSLPLALDITYLAPPSRRRFQLDRFFITSPVVPPEEVAIAGLREIHEEGFHFDPAIMLAGAGDLLRGYFQSERYFAAHMNVIREEFQLASPMSGHSLAWRAEISAADFPIAVHVRDASKDGQRGIDYHGFCSPAYYAQALRLVSALAPRSPSFFVFSDDAAFARQQVGDLPAARFVTGNDERPWEDIALMAACASHITANSSFSWWGAWLGQHPAQTVVSPRKWFADDTMHKLNLVDLHPIGWILI